MSIENKIGKRNFLRQSGLALALVSGLGVIDESNLGLNNEANGEVITLSDGSKIAIDGRDYIRSHREDIYPNGEFEVYDDEVQLYIGNRWVDSNKDKKMDLKREIVGKGKRKFKENERVTLFAQIQNHKGDVISFEVVDPKNKYVFGRSYILTKNDQVAFAFHDVKSILEARGSGEYTANFYLYEDVMSTNRKHARAVFLGNKKFKLKK